MEELVVWNVLVEVLGTCCRLGADHGGIGRCSFGVYKDFIKFCLLNKVSVQVY